MKRTRPLVRRAPLKADPAKARAWADASRKELPRDTPIKQRNPARLAKREAANYGPKARWLRGLSCYVTGWQPTEDARCVAAHVKSRGAGGDSADLVPFHPLVEIDWHGMHEAAFEDKYGVGKQDCRDAAERYEAAWREITEDYDHTHTGDAT
jgi:hypothetical protein